MEKWTLISTNIKEEKKGLQNKIRNYAEGCKDLMKKNNAFKAEKLKYEDTIMVLKD